MELDATKIAELGIGAIAAVASIVAVIAAYMIGNRQEHLQLQLARTNEQVQRSQARELAAEQSVAGLCSRLSEHLTRWHDTLTDIAQRDDRRALESFRESLLQFREAAEEEVIRLHNFMEKKEFQGPLDAILTAMDRHPQCCDASTAVRDFQSAALDFKDGMVSGLRDQIGMWYLRPLQNQSEKRRLLGEIDHRYQRAMEELGKLMSLVD